MAETTVQLSEELYFQNNTATLFHRTGNIDTVEDILKRGWSDSGSGYYGRGIYTNYKLENQLSERMIHYGNVLLKFKYNNIKNLVFFTPEMAKKVHPDGYSLKEQFDKLYPNHGISDSDFTRYQNMVDTQSTSAPAAKALYENHDNIADHLHGIEYFGGNDGPCILIYPPAKDTLLLAVADVAGLGPNDKDKIKWMSISAVKKLGPKVFGKGLYSPETHSLSITKDTDTASIVSKLSNLYKRPHWDVQVIEDLIKILPARKALEIVNNNVAKFGYPSTTSSLSYIEFIEYVRNDPDTFTLLLQSALKYDQSPRTFVDYILKNYRSVLTVKHVKMIVEKYPDGLPINSFFNNIVLTFSDQSELIIYLFDEFEKISPKKSVQKELYAPSPCIIESVVINAELDTVKKVFPHFKSVYEKYGKDDYLKLVKTSLSVRSQRVPGFPVTDYLLELFDGPNHNLLSGQDFSFIQTTAFGSTELRDYLIGYVSSHKSDFKFSIETGKDVVKYLVGSKNFTKLKNVLDDFNRPAIVVGEFLVKTLGRESLNSLFRDTTDFLKYLPYVVEWKIGNYPFHRYLESVSFDESKMDLAFQSFANARYKLNEYQMNGCISYVFLSRDPSVLTRFLKTLFKHRSIFDYDSFNFRSIFKDLNSSERTSLVVDTIYSIDPTFFTAIPDKKTYIEKLLAAEANQIGMKFLMPPFNLIDVSQVDLSKLFVRTSSGVTPYVPDYFYNFIISKDSLFSSNTNKPFLLHLLTTSHYPSIIEKINKYNPTLFSSLTPDEFSDAKFNSFNQSVIPTKTDIENIYSGFMAILEGLKNNKSLKDFELYTFVATFTKRIGIRSNPDKFVNFVKKLIEVKGKDLTPDVVDDIADELSVKSFKTNSEVLLNGVGVSEIVLNLLNTANPSYLKVIDNDAWVKIYQYAKNKPLIYDYAISTDFFDTLRIAEMYGYTPAKDKGEFVKKVFGNPNIEFGSDLVFAFLQDTYTPEIAKMLLDRSTLNTWKAKDLAVLTNYNEYKNSQVRSYVYKRLIPKINELNDEGVSDFVRYLYGDRDLMYLFKVKRNLTYNQVKTILFQLDRFSSMGGSDMNSLFKTTARYHGGTILGYVFKLLLIESYSKETTIDNYVSVLKTLPSISNALIQITLQAIMDKSIHFPPTYLIRYYKKILDVVMTNKKDIDGDTLFVFLNEYSVSETDNPVLFDATYYEFFEKVFKRKLKLTDREVAVLLTYIPKGNKNIPEPPINIYNTIFNIISRSGFSVRDTYHLCKSAAELHGLELMTDAQLIAYQDRIIEKQKSSLSKDHILYLLNYSSGRQNLQHIVDKVKNYVDNEWLKRLIAQRGYDVTLQEDIIKYSDYFMNTLNESMTPASQMDMDKAFDVFDASYKKSTGKSWDKQKFISRASNWVFFGNDKGYVAVRPQRGGMIKLVGVAGNPKSILGGFHEMTTHYANTPIWGAVSSDIADMTVRVDPNFKKLTVPGGMLGTVLFNIIKSKIPANVFGGATIKQANADGTITFDYPDVGETNKVLIGNKEYFEVLKGMVLNDPRLAKYQSVLSKLF